MSTCIFCRIARHEIPKDFGYEDKDVMVFDDLNPLLPVHILIVPKAHIKDLKDVEDNKIWNKIRLVAQDMIKKKKLTNKGYRFTINGGGAQVIDHLHIHITGPLGKSAKM